MPRRIVRRKRRLVRRPRRTLRRRRIKRRGRPSTAVMRGPTGFPDRIRVKVNYFTTISFVLAPSPGSAGQFWVLRGNSLFDPEYAIGGSQPYAHDQWAAFYTRYRVYGSALQLVSCLPNSSIPGQTNTGATVTIVPSTTPTPISSGITGARELREMPYSRTWGSTLYTPIRGKKYYMSTAKITGVSKSNVKIDPNYSAIIANDPNREWFWIILMMPTTQSSETNTWECQFKITYYAEYYDRNPLNLS